MPSVWPTASCRPGSREIARLASRSFRRASAKRAERCRGEHPDLGTANFYSWWDYRQLGFPKNDGLRIDHILATAPLARRCTGASIDREARKGKQPSDHAPVIAIFET